jgi:putative addiction module component (TIGR02574 family)
MTDAKVQAIFDEALALPDAARAALVERLLESLPFEADELNDADFLKELERRSTDFDRGLAEGIPWSELKKES